LEDASGVLRFFRTPRRDRQIDVGGGPGLGDIGGGVTRKMGGDGAAKPFMAGPARYVAVVFV